MELKNKVAVVTGGAIRVGRAITLALAQQGCHVMIHYGRSALQAHQTQAEASAYGVETCLCPADLEDVAATQTIVPTAISHFGRLDILINSAAIFPETDRFDTTDLALWNLLFNINLRAPFLLSQAFAAQIPGDGMGKIVNIVDARVRRPLPDHFVYRLTKGALWQMTEMMAHELAPCVTVNAVALGAILPPPGKDSSYLENLAQSRVPLRRAGNADIVANNVLHLLENDFLTGVVIPIDGGEFL